MDRLRADSHTARVIIRREHPRDHDAVRAVHLAAFTRDPVSGAVRAPEDVVEARLVDGLREDAGFLPHLSLVAVLDDVVTGHVLVTRGWLEPAGAPVLGLGPLSVLPDAQGSGVGTALVHSVLAVAEAAGEMLVALLGSLPTTAGSGSGPPGSSPSWRRTHGGAGTSRRGGWPGRGPEARSGTPTPSSASSGGGPGAG